MTKTTSLFRRRSATAQISAIHEIQTRLRHLKFLDYMAILGVLIGLVVAVYTYTLRHP